MVHNACSGGSSLGRTWGIDPVAVRHLSVTASTRAPEPDRAASATSVTAAGTPPAGATQVVCDCPERAPSRGLVPLRESEVHRHAPRQAAPRELGRACQGLHRPYGRVAGPTCTDKALRVQSAGHVRQPRIDGDSIPRQRLRFADPWSDLGTERHRLAAQHPCLDLAEPRGPCGEPLDERRQARGSIIAPCQQHFAAREIQLDLVRLGLQPRLGQARTGGLQRLPGIGDEAGLDEHARPIEVRDATVHGRVETVCLVHEPQRRGQVAAQELDEAAVVQGHVREPVEPRPLSQRCRLPEVGRRLLGLEHQRRGRTPVDEQPYAVVDAQQRFVRLDPFQR